MAEHILRIARGTNTITEVNVEPDETVTDIKHYAADPLRAVGVEDPDALRLLPEVTVVSLGVASEPVLVQDYSEMSVEELKGLLRDRELPVSGNKDELVERLNQAK